MPLAPDPRIAPAISVDPAVLHQLADTLARIAALLRDHVQIYPDVGDEYVSAALRDVQRDWSDARDAVCSFLDDAGRAAHSAAEGYDCVEQAICRAAQ